MNKILKVTLSMLLFLCFYDLEAQTDFRPGYVITNQNDTLKGFIDYRGDTRNSKKCDFKESETSQVKEYQPLDIKAYRLNDSKYYVSKKIQSGGPEKQLFLEFLVDGIADLYYYANGSEAHYFIEKKNGQLFELIKEQERAFIDGKLYEIDKKGYIGLLRYAFGDCPNIFPLLDNTTLDNKSLVEATKKYHEYVCTDQQCIIYEKKLPGIKISFGAYLSMNGSTLTFSNSRDMTYAAMKVKMAFYPSVGFLLNATLPRMNEKLTFQASGEIGKSYYYGTGSIPQWIVSEELKLHLVTMTSSVGVKYTYPKGKIRPTFALRGNAIWLLSKDDKRTVIFEDGADPSMTDLKSFMKPNLLYGYSLKAGVDYHINSSVIPFLSLGYDDSVGQQTYALGPPNSPLSYTARARVSARTISLTAGIYF